MGNGFRYGAFFQKTILGCCMLAVLLAGGSVFAKNLLPSVTAEVQVTDTPVLATPPVQQNTEGTSRVGEVLAAIDPMPYGSVEYLKQQVYTVDSRTTLLPEDVDAEDFLQMDFSLEGGLEEPRVLIFHTHSTEMFADSDADKDMNEGIWGTGEYLKTLLTGYGIPTLHSTERFDIVDGHSQITGAYERMEPVIAQVLAENPSIEVVIDLHRDGLNDETIRLVTEVNGKPTAKIMFFNGLCRTLKNGEPVPAPGLSNPYVRENLAFSFQLQMAADTLYPGLCRKGYINAYRYSLHFRPRSLLIEVGAQTSTKAEAAAAMEPLAELLAGVLLP